MRNPFVDKAIIAPVVGLALVVTGLALMRWHHVAWRQQKHDPSLSDAERTHYFRRYRRRMQTSALLALLGLLMGVGDFALTQLRAPAPWLFLIWIAAMLLLVLWIILLALGDMASTAVHSRRELTRVRQEQRALEQRLEDLKSRRSNGRRSPE